MQLGLSREFESYQGGSFGSWMAVGFKFLADLWMNRLISSKNINDVSSQAVMLSGEAASGNFPLEAVA